MDIVYTDANRVDKGVMQHFNIDYNTTDTKDFVLKVGINSHILAGGCWWYIDGTEYGGVVDSMEVKTESREIDYAGRNFRGILASKIIQPSAGQDYKTVSGNLQTVVNGLLKEIDMTDIFIAEKSNVNITSYQFARYINAYDGLTALARSVGKIMNLTISNGLVHLSFTDYIDYSDTNEYSPKDLKFTISRNFKLVNHLICLGQGELKERTVIHIYTDASGNVTPSKRCFGMDEVSEIYENTSAADTNELYKGGLERLKELNAQGEFTVDADDVTLHIGDIIGGYEETTGFYVKAEIQNVIATIDDNRVNLKYEVGGGNAELKVMETDRNIRYPVPWASRDVMGGIKAGGDFNISTDGTLSYEMPESLATFHKELIDVCE